MIMANPGLGIPIPKSSTKNVAQVHVLVDSWPGVEW